jgi:hypothetical protein
MNTKTIVDRLRVLAIPESGEDYDTKKKEYEQQIYIICSELVMRLSKYPEKSAKQLFDALRSPEISDIQKLVLRGVNLGRALDTCQDTSSTLYNTARRIDDVMRKYGYEFAVPSELSSYRAEGIMLFLYVVCGCFVRNLYLVNVFAAPSDNEASRIISLVNIWLADVLLNVDIPLSITEEDMKKYLSAVGKDVVAMCQEYFKD